MKKIILGMALFFGVSAVAQQAGPPPDLEIPSNLKQYIVVFLVEEAGKAHDDPQMMKNHLAFIRKQVEVGKVALVGPFTDHGKIAGMFIMDVPSAEDAQKILSDEPMTKAGWVKVEAHPAMLPDLSMVKIVYPPKKPQSFLF